jgi:hypothetical protein
MTGAALVKHTGEQVLESRKRFDGFCEHNPIEI